MGFNHPVFNQNTILNSITIFLTTTLWTFIVFMFFIVTIFNISNNPFLCNPFLCNPFPCNPFPYILAFIVYIFGTPGCIILHSFIRLLEPLLPSDIILNQCSHNWFNCQINIICPGLGAVFYYLLFKVISYKLR